MSKRTAYTIVTPLPPAITREIAVSLLHNHSEMIELNPLVIDHHRIKPPRQASADEFQCVWYKITDRLTYLPGIKGQVSFDACFHDLPVGLQTHIYAPLGLDIKTKWWVGGNMPGEPREVRELGLKDVPRDGLYLREDCEFRCNFVTAPYVKKNLKSAHSVLVDRLLTKGEVIEDRQYRESRSKSESDPTDGG